jgi:maleate cis-trans isomerase
MMNKRSFLSALSLGVLATAEAVFFGGNGFRAIGMIAALEQALGRPVLTGNQVVFKNHDFGRFRTVSTRAREGSLGFYPEQQWGQQNEMSSQ